MNINSTKSYQTNNTGIIINYSVNGEPVDVKYNEDGSAYISWTTNCEISDE